MKQVRLTGTGQLNGPVIINKTIELDDKVALSLTGSKRDEVKVAILAVHYPGVKINPNNIGCEIKNIKVNKPKKPTSNSSIADTVNRYENKKKSFTIFSIITFLLFWPFKLLWWLIKKIFNENHL